MTTLGRMMWGFCYNAVIRRVRVHGVACPIGCGVCSHLAARPFPVGVISPSAFMARNTTRTMSRLMPGHASSISEIENGKLRLRISARTRLPLATRRSAREWQQSARSTGGRNPAWRCAGDFGQEKGPGDFPSPCNWWWNTEPNPRPQSEPDSNASALSPPIRRLGQFDHLLRHRQWRILSSF